MNNIITDVKNLEIETLKNLKNSKSKNTLRAYESDFKDFSLFCSKSGFASLPTQPKIIALYLTNLSKSSRFSTLKRRIASISVIHKLKGHYLDTKHPIIMENLHGIKRTLGSRQRAKKPILINDLKVIIKALDEEIIKTKIDKKIKIKEQEKMRNKALILIGFAGGFRRSELVDINYDDLEFVNEGVKILIKRSKTDQSGEGTIKAIPYFDNEFFCPVIALKEFLKCKEFDKLKSQKIFDLSDKSVALILKKYASLAGLDSSKYAGHSLRSGFATTAAEFGAEERTIMAMTGHKTTQMVRRYIQEANLFKNNALNKIKI
jgi:site-specific recombinase XerD